MSRIKPRPPFGIVVVLYRELEFHGLRLNMYSIDVLSNCFCRLGRVDLAFGMLGKWVKLGWRFDAFIFTMLMRGLCSLGRWGDVEVLLCKMLENGVEPNVRTYNMLIDMYGKAGMVGQTRVIIECMIEKGVCPSVITYNNLLNGYCLLGHLEEAEKLLDLMPKCGYEPNEVTFNIFINGYSKHKRLDKALDVFENMRVKGISPSVVTYNTIIDALCKDYGPTSAYHLIGKMEAEGLRPDVVTYSTLIDGFCKNRQLDKAVLLFELMKARGIHPSIVTHTALIDGFYKADQFEKAVDAFSILQTSGLEPDVTTYNIMIRVFCKMGLFVDACRLFKEMEDNGCTPDECTFNSIIKGFIAAIDVGKALEFLKIMSSRRFVADSETASLLVGLLTSHNVSDKDKALIWNFVEEYDVSEAQLSIKSLEALLAVSEEKFSQLAEEKRELEVERESVINALALAERDVSRVAKEKEEAELSSAASEAELNKAKSEIADLIADLSKSTTKVKALEDTVSQIETRLNALNVESNEAQISRSILEDDLKKFKEEADNWDSKLQGAQSSINTLEDALARAENHILELSDEKKAKEQELSTLSAKLNACLEELAGTHGSLESRTLGLFDHIKGLEVVVEDESVTSSLRRCFEMKYESLKEMDGLLRNIRCQFAEMDPKMQLASEDPSHLTKLLSTNLDAILPVGTVTNRVDAVESDDISLYIKNMTGSFHVKNKALAEQVDRLLSFVNESNASILQELLSTSKLVTPMAEKMNSLCVNMKNMETDYCVLGNKVTALENDVSSLLSACTEATQLLEYELNTQIPEIMSIHEFEGEIDPVSGESKHVIAINKLLSTSKKVSSAFEQLQKSRTSLSSTTEELQSSLNEAKVAANKAMEERNLYSNKVHELETDLATIQNLCNELRLKLENYQDIEAHLRDKNAEVSSLKSALMTKEKEAGEAHLWASHAKNLLERADKIQVSMEASDARDLVPQDSVQIGKLFYIIDNFRGLQDQIESLTHENTELETALSVQIHETEHLREQVQDSVGYEQELETIKSKIGDMQAGLNGIIQKFSRKDISGHQNVFDVDDLVQILEELVMEVILESENRESKAHELELEAANSIITQQESAKLKEQIVHIEAGVQNIIKILKSDISLDQKSLTSSDLILVLEDLVKTVVLERETLKSKAHELDTAPWKSSNEQELVEIKDELVIIEGGLKEIIQKLRGDATVDQRPVATRDLLQHVEKMIMALILETENSKSEIRELDSKLLGSQKMADELSLKVKSLEDSLRSRTASPDFIQERSIFEAPSLPPTSEISEIEDVGSVSKSSISPAPSSTHVRTTWKGSSDHIALNIDSESSRLIDNDAVEDKGHVFKSLNTSGLVPIQGKMVADRLDGLWVAGGRMLMSRPRARLGLIAYWLFLNFWLLGTIL